MGYDYGRFVWFELMTTDKEHATTHYPEILSWKLLPMEMPGGTYTAIAVGEQPTGGIVDVPKKGMPAHWMSYVSVADVDATAKKVLAAGGKALMDAFVAPGVGRMQPVQDDQGAAFFLFHGEKEDAPAAKGDGAFHWNELIVRDPKAALAFYGEVLGYSHEAMQMPNGTYYVLKNGDDMRGGLMAAPSKEMPAAWLQYVTTSDCEATIERAKRHGCSLLGEVIEVPDVGRFAHLKDAQGAVFAIIKPAA
jgi:predicted enzyme related to lactoylglutathione lyase